MNDREFTARLSAEMPVLIRQARRLTRTRHDAEDLLQHTLLMAWQHRLSFEGTHLRSWLCTIMRNHSVNARMQASRRRTETAAEIEAVADKHVFSPPRQEAAVTLREALAIIRGLPNFLRTPLVCVGIGGEKNVEVAKRLGVPEGTASQRIWAARSVLREAFA